jgi:6-phosphogluconolactonase (cycloisomerase 2 family)
MTISQRRGGQHGILLWLTLGLLAACGGGGNSTPTYIVSGTVSGLLTGTSVVLQDNGADNLTISANGTVGFHSQIAGGGHYAVTVLTQPTGENCTVTSGGGVVSSSNVNVAVMCTPISYKLGGSVSGLLTGNSVVLQNSTVGTATVSANGAYAFSTPITSSSAYAVTVTTQPPGQNCSVANGSGTVAGANITNIAVTCAVLPYTISANVVGLLPNSNLVLQDNGGNNLTVSTGGTFTFTAAIPSGSAYAVTILSQPAGQSCAVPSGSGTVVGAPIKVTITCPWHVLYVANNGRLGASGNGSVSAFIIDPTTGALTQVPGSPFSAGAVPWFVTADKRGRFAYVSGLNSQGTGKSIFAFSISATTGALTPVPGNPVAAGTTYGPILINPSGTFAYIEDGSDGVYAIDPTSGTLTLSSNSGAGGGQLQDNFTINPAGTIAYGTYIGGPPNGGVVIKFSIDAATGALTQTATYAAGNYPFDVGITPNGAFAYISDFQGFGSGAPDGLSAYAIDASTGALTAVAGSPFATGNGPETVTINPSGTHVYVVNYGDSSISGYAINPMTGVLTLIPGSPFAAGVSLQDFKIDPSGKFAYAANLDDDTLSGYAINATTGKLTPIPGSPFPVGGVGPNSIAITAVP